MKKILASTSAGVLMAGGLLVATAQAPAQADPYGPTYNTFCQVSDVREGRNSFSFKLRTTSNSDSGWTPAMSVRYVLRNGGGRAIDSGTSSTRGTGSKTIRHRARFRGPQTVSVIASPKAGSAFQGCTARFSIRIG